MTDPDRRSLGRRRSLRRLLILFLCCALAAIPLAGSATAKPPKPDFRGFSAGEQKRLLSRVNDAPAPYRRLLEATYPRIKLKASSDFGSYVVNRGEGASQRFTVFLDPPTRDRGKYGDHLTVHELGHVVANRYFDEPDYQRFFELFRRSPNWRECFETGSPDIPCVFREEVLADQLAFYANGDLEFRSSYDVPPLASAAEIAEAIQASD